MAKREGVVAVLLLVTGVAGPLGSQDLRFATAASYPTADFQAAIAAGDLNADSRLDLVLTLQSGLTVLLGRSAGGFGRATSYRGEGQRFGLALADFNGDGRLDAVQIKDPGQLALFTGTGTGAFSGPTLYSTGPSALHLTAGDLNGDGRVDIATGSEDTGDVYTHLNLGGGLFSVPQVRHVGQVAALKAADLNHDGRADLVVAHPYYTSAAETVLLSDGSGGLAPGPSLALAGRGAAFLGDVNGDGHVDILDPGLDLKVVNVFLGAGDGSFTPASVLPAPGSPSRVAAGDVNEDGHVDVVTTDFDANAVSVFPGAGDGSFGPGVPWGANFNPIGIVLAHLDADLHLDAAVASGNALEVSVLSGAGDGAFRAAPLTPMAAWSQPIAVSDLNADGRSDLAATTQSGVAVLLGQSDRGFALPATTVVPDPQIKWTTLGDFDGDGLRDLASTNEPSGQVVLNLGDGAGSFGPSTTLPLGMKPGQLDVVDLDGNGFDDLLVPRQNADDVAVLMGLGGASLDAPVFYPVGDNPIGARCADFDGDGLLDIAVANQYSNDLSLLRGLPGGGFAGEQRYPTDLAPVRLAIADLDGNSRKDLVVANTTAGTVTIFLGHPRGLVRARSYRAGTYPSGVAVGDLDADQRADLVAVDTYDRKIMVFRGLGGGRFASPKVLSAAEGEPAIGDYDGDHRPDLAVTNLGDVWFFRNLTPMADLDVTLDDGQTTLAPGSGTTYTMQVTNHGPENVADARVSLRWSSTLGKATWSCSASTGATCPSGGTRHIDQKISLDAGSTATFVLTSPSILPGSSCTKVTASADSRTLRDQGPGNDKASDVNGVAPAISLRAAQGSEPAAGTRALRFLATLDRSTCQEVTATYSSNDGTATAGQDYDPISGLVVFPAGSTGQWIDLPLRADDLVEGAETLTITLQDPVAATLATSQATGTILDNEP